MIDMSFFLALLLSGLAFGRNLVGIVSRPYETYRRIADRANPGELFYLGGLLSVYFGISSLVKTASFRPFLLTKEFMVLVLAAGVSFAFTVIVLYGSARVVGGKGKLLTLAVAWAYTLIPTLIWFLTTSLLYVLLPPPRTARPLGIVYSLLYLIFSATLFWWKAILAYLVLRFSMRLDLVKILAVTAVALPILTGYSFLMYRWGIFKVPFL